MLKKLNWGIIALIVFMISAGVFIYWNMSSVHQIKKQLAQDDKSSETDDKPQVQHVASFADQKPPDEPGFEWVRHNDHWDKVPINALDTWQDTSHQNDTFVRVSSDTPDTSIPAAVAASDEVPKYAELKAMSDEELITLMETSHEKTRQLSPEVSRLGKEWAQSKSGSEREKRLGDSWDAVVWDYNVHSITSSKAFKVLHRRLLNEISKLPDHPMLMKFHPLPDNLVD